MPIDLEKWCRQKEINRVSRHPPPRCRPIGLAAPVESRFAPLFCLTAAGALASLAFACATPFAAFGALAQVL
jgi:hypothetical protein